jgi:hypothetical protein
MILVKDGDVDIGAFLATGHAKKLYTNVIGRCNYTDTSRWQPFR